MEGSRSALALGAASAWVQRAAPRGAALRDGRTHLLNPPHGLNARKLIRHDVTNKPGWRNESVDFRAGKKLIRTSISEIYSCSVKLSTRLDHINHCKTASGTN